MSHRPVFAHRLTSLGRTVFRHNRIDGICRSSGASVSLPPAELPPSYFYAPQSIHARPALPSRSFQRRSPQAISELFLRFPLCPRLCLPSFLPSFLPAFLPSFLPSFLPCSSGSSVSLPSRRRKLNENPSTGDAFGNNACIETNHALYFVKPSRNPGRKQEKTRGITELFHMYRLYRHDSRCINASSTNMFAF